MARLFELEMSRERQRLLSRTDRQACTVVGSRASTSVRLSRQRRLTTAECYLEEACAAAAPLREPARLFACVSLDSSLAYLHHCRGEFAAARARTQLAMRAGACLIDDHGAHVLEANRIQQVHNLGRIEVRHGDLVSAGAVFRSLLRYIAGESDEWRADGACPRPHARDRLPQQLLDAMLGQVRDEWNEIERFGPEWSTRRTDRAPEERDWDRWCGR